MNEPPTPGDAHALRTGGKAVVREALLDLRARTLQSADAFARALDGADMRVPRVPTLDLPLWELGHIAWFQDWWISRNLQRSRGTACDPAHERAPSALPGADALFDSTRIAHAARWDLQLPDATATRAYLDAAMDRTLQALDDLGNELGDDAVYFFRLVALHEAMHAETAASMARELGIRLAHEAAGETLLAPAAALRVPGQVFRMGWTGPGFAFDNELAAHAARLEAFEIDATPVTWRRFNKFVRAGGYTQRRWWDDEGWAWLQRSGPPGRPAGLIAPDAAATRLNAYEAEAWCRWAGRRLPTEAEWECAALTQPSFRWGQAWEWTATPFEPYPGYVAHPYKDYSVPWFTACRVLRGACPATSRWLAHPRYRNFLAPAHRHAFAGFRSCA